MYDVFSTEKFEAAYTYTGNDLGSTWSKDKTTFRLWAPTADEAFVKLYQTGNPESEDFLRRIPMTPAEKGTWVLEIDGDLSGIYYTYQVHIGGYVAEACDPYAKATGVNGVRAMVINLEATNPQGWEQDKDPNGDAKFTDAVIYELHLRDLCITHTLSGRG